MRFVVVVVFVVFICALDFEQYREHVSEAKLATTGFGPASALLNQCLVGNDGFGWLLESVAPRCIQAKQASRAQLKFKQTRTKTKTKSSRLKLSSWLLAFPLLVLVLLWPLSPSFRFFFFFFNVSAPPSIYSDYTRNASFPFKDCIGIEIGVSISIGPEEDLA